MGVIDAWAYCNALTNKLTNSQEMDREHPLVLARKSLEGQFLSLDDSFDSALSSDPEECVRALTDPWNATALKRQLKVAGVDWVRVFLEAGGLDALWNILETCTNDGIVRSTGILRCTECIKTLLSFPEALDLLVARAGSMKYIDKLLNGNYTML